MSRKAMKKTLGRLKNDAFGNVRDWIKDSRELVERFNKMTSADQATYYLSWRSAYDGMYSLLTYIEALEDAYSEFAEDYDKLEVIKAEKMKKAIENMDKPIQKKDEGKQKKEGEKPFYT